MSDTGVIEKGRVGVVCKSRFHRRNLVWCDVRVLDCVVNQDRLGDHAGDIKVLIDTTAVSTDRSIGLAQRRSTESQLTAKAIPQRCNLPG